MSATKVLTSFTFRFMLAYVVGLSVAVFLVMAFIYGIFSYSYFQDLQESIVEELETLTLIYEGQGVTGVEQYIADQSERGSGKFYYLLADLEFEKVAGTLEQWPEYREFGDGWASFGLDATEFTSTDAGLELLARPQTMGDGYHLLAALRFSDIIESSGLVMRTLFRTMLATVLMGVIGGYFSAAATMRRIEGINSGINDIVQGDLSQRIPPGDATGNMRLLIDNFNNMLDQTESLMHGVRTVSDNIAHDLRTPLTRMRNSLSQLQTEFDGEDDGRVQEIIEECDGILGTFNALLRIAQLEVGNRRTSFHSLNVGALVRDVVDLYEPLAQDKNIHMHIHCEDLQYDGDRDLLFQMMANLLDNAVKYTGSGGAISVTVRGGLEGEVLLSVTDNGPGIPSSDRENVFRRFFRLESSRSAQPGNGLGLSLVQAVVKAHKGLIRLLDNQPGLRVEVSLS